MTKRKNKGKGVRSKTARAKKRTVKSVDWLRKRKALLDRKAKRPPVSESQSHSESPDAEGGTPGSAPSIQEVAMELGSQPEEPEPRSCPNCNSHNTSSHMERDEFGYGVAPNTYVLTADVLVFECFDCKQRWTGEQAEGARQAAVDAHLAQKKAAEDGEIFL
jgi:hypothetical protein